MNQYISGELLKELREQRGITQLDLANEIGVSDKTISKWETGKGLPDITLLEPLSKALHTSVAELLTGEQIVNRNISGNMLKSNYYVCPICGNVIHSLGEALVSCHGVQLPKLETELSDDHHNIVIERVENESYVSIDHEMTKEHYISFLAYVTSNKMEIIKLYPEGNAEARFLIRGRGKIYGYCNRHGLFGTKV